METWLQNWSCIYSCFPWSGEFYHTKNSVLIEQWGLQLLINLSDEILVEYSCSGSLRGGHQEYFLGAPRSRRGPIMLSTCLSIGTCQWFLFNRRNYFNEEIKLDVLFWPFDEQRCQKCDWSQGVAVLNLIFFKFILKCHWK